METLFFVLALVTVGFGLVSARFDHSLITPPMIFTGIGVLLALSLGEFIPKEQSQEILKIIAELTLVFVLFIDASRIRLPLLIRDYAIPLRLLGIGLPLTVLLGAVIAWFLFPQFSIWEACLLAAVLAPTDAALGQAVVTSPKVPLKIRQSLNVESGLNDGIVLPLVMLFAALAVASTDAPGQSSWLGYWLQQVTLGPLAGGIVGGVGGFALGSAKKSGTINPDFLRLSGVALALLAWSGALLVGGNGFIAAFVAGLIISCTADNIGDALRDFGEAEGQWFALATFLLFGMIGVIPAIQQANVACWVYALLSLTVIRMLPVALSVIGLKFHSPTILFLGWFGPRGLASLLFALVVFDEFDLIHGNQILHVAILTVVASILAHGFSAVPGANWYSSALKKVSSEDSVEHRPCVEHRDKFTLKTKPKGSHSV